MQKKWGKGRLSAYTALRNKSSWSMEIASASAASLAKVSRKNLLTNVHGNWVESAMCSRLSSARTRLMSLHISHLRLDLFSSSSILGRWSGLQIQSRNMKIVHVAAAARIRKTTTMKEREKSCLPTFKRAFIIFFCATELKQMKLKFLTATVAISKWKRNWLLSATCRHTAIFGVGRSVMMKSKKKMP